MQNDILASLNRVTDAELVAHMKILIARERDVTAELIAHLAELDTRDVHLREGYASLFVYCRDALGLSEWEAYNRIEVARAARRFPVILGMLAEGSVNLTAVRLLAPHLTPSNHLEVLRSARGKRKPEVEAIVAALAPRPDVACSVRRLPTPESAFRAATEPVSLLVSPAASGSRSVSAAPDPAADGTAPGVGHRASPASGAPAAPVTPLSPDRYKLQVTIGGETLEMLRLAKDMLGHAIPSGDDAAVLDRALRALLADLANKKFGETRTPRPSPSRVPSVQNPCAAVRRPGARNPSAAVKRIVWVRDLGRCAFVGAGGHRCNERRFVEFHHVDPYALGGDATVDGIQLRCRRHNDYEGRLYFGKRRRDRELVLEQVGLRVARSSGRPDSPATGTRHDRSEDLQPAEP